MKEEELKNVTTESLIKKKKSQNFMIGLLMALCLALLYFPISEWMSGESLEAFDLIMPLCCLGGAATVWPERKSIVKELNRRNA